MPTDVYMCSVVLGLMAFDIITGYAAAMKESRVSSSEMRRGLFSKFGSIVVLLLAEVVSFGGVYVGINEIICTAVAMGVSGSLAGMELTSVLENCCKLNPDLPIAKLFQMFGIEKEGANDQD